MSLASRHPDDRRAWRSLRLRIEQLPLATRTAVVALETYLTSTAPADDAGRREAVAEIVTRFERAYAEGTSITGVVGGDVVAFADAIEHAIGQGAWRSEQQARLVEAFVEAEREQGPQ
jgi:DNA-binding ferritin-like protein (Dps family)